MNHICPNNLSLWQSMTKPQQTNEHMREVINHLTHIHLLNTIKIYPNTNSWKTLQEESLWQVNFYNLYFWNTLNKTLAMPGVRTYVIHLLGTYVTILCNWLLLWQNTFYFVLGRSRMCLILQETMFQDQVLKTCKSVQDSRWRSVVYQSSTASYPSSLRSCSSPEARQLLDSTSTDSYLSSFMKNRIPVLFWLQSGFMCLGFLFSQP